MYTPLYKVQLYITSFTHRSKLCDSLVHRDLPHEQLLLTQSVFTSAEWSEGFTDTLDEDGAHGPSSAPIQAIKEATWTVPKPTRTCSHAASVIRASWQDSETHNRCWIHILYSLKILKIICLSYGHRQKRCELAKCLRRMTEAWQSAPRATFLTLHRASAQASGH